MALDIDGTEFNITRAGNPNYIDINGTQCEQHDIDTLLKLSKSRFLHSVIFGQAVPLFMDLSVPERGQILDEILELEHWTELSERAGRKADEMSKELRNLDNWINRETGKLDALPDEAVLRISAGEWDDQNKEKVANALANAEVLEKEVDALKQRIKVLKAWPVIEGERASNASDIHRKNMVLREVHDEIQKALNKISDLENELKYYTTHEVCNVCQQDISPEFARDKIANARKEIAALKKESDDLNILYHDGVSEVAKLQNDDREKASRDNAAAREIAGLEGSLAANERALDKALKAVEDAASDNTNPYRQRIAETRAKRDATVATIAQLNGEKDALAGKITANEYWKQGFRRIRLFIIKRTLSTLDVEIASAASALGLPSWQIRMQTEVEGKTAGTVKQGVQILVKSPDAPSAWVLWSGGEEQRIKLAVSLGIASLIQRMAGVSFNFEVWDEPTAWLSTEGIDDLLECLQYRALSAQKSVWLLDHRTLGYGGFSEVWTITKTSRGSRMKLTARDV